MVVSLVCFVSLVVGAAAAGVRLLLSVVVVWLSFFFVLFLFCFVFDKTEDSFKPRQV